MNLIARSPALGILGGYAWGRFISQAGRELPWRIAFGVIGEVLHIFVSFNLLNHCQSLVVDVTRRPSWGSTPRTDCGLSV
jgi:hypothetical protein